MTVVKAILAVRCGQQCCCLVMGKVNDCHQKKVLVIDGCFGLLLLWCIRCFSGENFNAGSSHSVEDIVVPLIPHYSWLNRQFFITHVVLIN